MKVIIAGSRRVKDMYRVEDAVIESGFKITEVVSGECAGTDTLGRQWADERGIPVSKFPAKWNDLKCDGAVIKTRKDGSKYNHAAGFLRNSEMARYADALIAIKWKDWGIACRGTLNMIEQAKQNGLKVYVKEI